MIMLSEKTIMEYQQLYKQTFRKEISYDDAADQGERLIGLVKAVYKPLYGNIKKYGQTIKKGN